MTSLDIKDTAENGPGFSGRAALGVKRVLILGHSGFIGSHIEKMFRLEFPSLKVAGSSAQDLDLTREEDAEQLGPSLDSETLVVMCAGVKRQFGDNLDTFADNVRIAVNLSRQLQKRPVKRMFFFSSAAVYGEEIHNTNITEQTPVHPTSFYGAAKYASECLFKKVFSGGDCGSLVILRPPVIYGPGDTGGGYGPSGFLEAIRNGESVTLWGDGLERREFIFVEDVARLVGRLAAHEFSGVLNVASGRSYTYLEIVGVVSQLLEREVEMTSRRRTKNKVDHVFCNTTISTLLPDFSFTPPAEGIRRMTSTGGHT